MTVDERRNAPARSIRAWLRGVLSTATTSTSVDELSQLTSKWTPSKREHLAAECVRSLLEEGADDERLRILLAKALVALLPASMPYVKRLLHSRAAAAPEAHFSLFAFLDDAAPVLSLDDRNKLLALVQHYLLNVNKSIARAPWMAGDLLGDHWPFEESTTVLIDTAKHARFVAGREGALHGISQALERVPKRLQWELIDTLKTVAQTDRSPKLRRHAQNLLGDLRPV